MKITVRKTDKRHTGHDIFGYVADVQWPGIGRRSERINDFLEVRKWCWDTLGNSCERDHWLELHKKGLGNDLNQRWCWQTDFGNFKIYLRTEKEANWFKLKWQ